MGFMLVGLAAVARPIWVAGIARWHMLPVMAATTFAVLGLTTVASAVIGGSSPPFGWPQTVLLLTSAGALVFGEFRRTPGTRLVAAALGALVLEASVTRYLAIDEWIAVIYACVLAIFLVLTAAVRPTLRPLVLMLLAVVAVSGTLHVLGVLFAVPGLYGAAVSLPLSDLVSDAALVGIAVGWFLRLRPSRFARPLRPELLAACAIVACVVALPLEVVGPSRAVLKETLAGTYATTLLVVGFGIALLVENRLPRIAAGPLLVALGSTALALSLDRAVSLESLAAAHDALALSAISLAIALTGVIRAQDGPIGGRIFAALAGPLALVTVLYLVSGLALRDLAAEEADGLDPAVVLAAAETSRNALFLANLAIAVVGGTLLTLTVTRPLGALLTTLRRRARGDRSARTGFTQRDELGTVGRALDVMIDETHAQSARLRSVVDSSLDAFIGLDGDGLIIDFNPQAEALTGWGREEILGLSLSKTLMPPLARRGFPSPAEWLARAGGTRVASRGRFSLLHRDGRLIQCEVSPTAVRLSSGEVIGGAFLHDISDEERRDADLQRLALFDSMTSLPNQTLFKDRFELAHAVAERDRSRVGLATIDIEHFKAVNESLGHDLGDDVLREVSRRLGALPRLGDTVARLRGAEFGVVITQSPGLSDAKARIEQYLAAIRKPLSVGGQVLYLTASAGMVFGSASYGAFADFLRGADLAANEAKRHGGDTLAIAPPLSVVASTESMSLVADLHRGVEQGELFLVYQPIVDLGSRACERVEALVRWQHPTRGLMMPTDFVPLAEQSHLIRSLGYWVIEHALNDLVEWRAAGCAWGVCVNVSAQQLSDAGFVASVLEALANRGLVKGALTLEVTEATFMERDSEVIGDLARLRAGGVRISIDDFGTGYSSVAQLGALPVDEVKIDRSLVMRAVRDRSGAAVVRASAALAMAFEIPFVAEGVEDETTWQFLRGLGHGSAQGHLIGRPMPSAVLKTWLASWER